MLSVAALHFIKLGLIVIGITVFIVGIFIIEILKGLKDKLRDKEDMFKG